MTAPRLYIGLLQVLVYYSSRKLLEQYFLLLEYSLLSISGCKFPLPVSAFAVNWNCWNLWKLGAARFLLSTCQSGNRYEYIHIEGVLVIGSDPYGP